MKIGILAVQGAFIEHKKMLEALNAECIEIRQKKDLKDLCGIVLPGGESTVQGQLLHKLDLFKPLKTLIEEGLPVLATCAGLILLSKKIEGENYSHLATLPVTVRRNAYGRQLGSFKTLAPVGELLEFPEVFIRAPCITEAGEEVKVLSKVDEKIVAVEYKNQLALAFHPEITEDKRLHEYFLEKCKKYSIS